MNVIPLGPVYLKLHRTGMLKPRGEILWDRMGSCDLCPRECRVNRLDGETGFCKAGSELRVASFTAHFGEERPLVGMGGSGTIFLSHCNLGCVYCQNWDISHQGGGTDCSIEDLATMMLKLQADGCENINVVTPTHYSPHVVLGLELAASRGLKVPLVYNTCGWERHDVLSLLDGVVDIYLADFKYSNPDLARIYSAEAESYPTVTQSALIEMNRQVGVAKAKMSGRILGGLMIRHLVMPGSVGASRELVSWIAAHLPVDTYVNLMLQYRPVYRARLYPEINRPVSRDEYNEVVEEARRCGLTNLDVDL